MVLEKPDQPTLPLDERFRQAEQYALDLETPPQPQPDTAHYCIGNCAICPLCDGS